MGKLVVESLNVKIAVLNGKDRLVTVKAVCRGPGDLCAVALLKPRHHIAPPLDGLWNIDLVSTLKVRGAEAQTTRELFFHGEADWCQGVRLHAEGMILEHRLAEHEVTGRQATASGTRGATERRMIPWPRASAALSPWLDPDRPPMIIPAGRPVPPRPRRAWR
ncbi:MAG: hypothetical protein ACKN9P_05760, partial [Phenylobacterium sp.]